MSRSTMQIERQVDRVRRRLFLQRLGWHVVVAWSAVLFLAAVAVVAITTFNFSTQPYSLENDEQAQIIAWRAGAAAAALLLALAGGVALALWRLPSRLDAALSLDKTFNLKERVTTVLSMPEAERSPLGRALFADVQQRLGDVRLGEGFPHRVSPWAGMVPLAAAAFLLATLFFHQRPPVVPPQQADPEQVKGKDDKQPEDVAKQLQQLQKPKEKGADLNVTQEMREIDAKLDELANRKPKDAEEARKSEQDLTNLADRMKKHDQDLANRTNALKEQAEQMDRLRKKEQNKGPGDKMEQAVNDGDFKKAEDQARELSRQLEDNKLSDEDKKNLERQLDELKDKLQSLSDEEKRKQELQDLKDKGELTDEQLQRELEQLKENGQQIDEATRAQLKEAAEKLEKANEDLKDGKDGEAAKELKDAADKLGELDKNGEQKDLNQKMQQVQKVQRQLNPQAVPGSGQRPEGKEETSKGKEEKLKGDVTAGKVIGLQHVPGQGRKGEATKPTNVPALVDAAKQETTEALERQKLEDGDKKLATGYYEKLNKAGQGSKPK